MDADPQTSAGDYLQGRFAASQQSYDFAAEAFNRAALAEGQAELDATAFRYALAAGDIALAERYARAIIAQDAQEADDNSHVLEAGSFVEIDLPRLTLVAQALADEQFDEAEALLSNAFESPLGVTIAHLLHGWIDYAQYGIEKAAKRLKSVPEGGYGGFNALHLALMYDLAGQGGTAEIAYAEALQNPGSDVALISYAGFVEREQGKQAALDLYRKMSADRGYLRRVGRIGRARLGDPLPGESDEFVRMAKKMPLRLVNNPREGAALVLQNFAWSAYEQALQRLEAAELAGFQDLDPALDYPLAIAQLSVAVDPNLGASHYIIGAVANAYDQYDVSAKANARVTPQSWLYNYAAIDRADSYMKMERNDDAIDLIEDYLKHDALAPDVILTLANLLAQSGDTEGAVEAATQAIEVADSLSNDETRSSNLWRYYFARGSIQVEADHWDDGVLDLEKALELEPEEPMLLNYLGYSYVERGLNLNEAFSMIERALEARPASGAITDSLGWAYYQRGDYEQAVKLLERAVELEPGDDVITDHLGDAYWQVGKKIEARYEWRRVLEVETLSAELREKVEAKLDGEPPAAGSLATQD